MASLAQTCQIFSKAPRAVFGSFEGWSKIKNSRKESFIYFKLKHLCCITRMVMINQIAELFDNQYLWKESTSFFSINLKYWSIIFMTIWLQQDSNPQTFNSKTKTQPFCQTGLNGWVFVYELSGCGFESRCSHLIFLCLSGFVIPRHTQNCWNFPLVTSDHLSSDVRLRIVQNERFFFPQMNWHVVFLNCSEVLLLLS